MTDYDPELEQRLMIKEEDFVLALSGSIRNYHHEIAKYRNRLAQLEHMYRRYQILRENHDLEYFTDPKGDFLYFRALGEEPEMEEPEPDEYDKV